MYTRPRTSTVSGNRETWWGRFYLVTGPASPPRWHIRRHRLGWVLDAGHRYASIGRRPAALVATVVAAVLVLAGCGASTPLASASQVCVTAGGHVRVDDFRCAGSSMAYDWWYLTAAQTAPRIGQRATVGTLTRPKGSIRAGVPATPTSTTVKKKPATPTKKQQATKKAKPAAPKPKPAAPKVRSK